MSTIQEITAALPNLSTDELRHIERAIRDLYRARHETIIYDDDYGIWTEHDQILAAEEIFRRLNKEEDLEQTYNLRKYGKIGKDTLGWTF